MLTTRRKEMGYFESMTTRTQDPSKQNLVLMGRKNWESIPAKFRPLKNRINVILSRTMTDTPCNGVYLCRGMDDFYSLLAMAPLCDVIETVWIIGGSEVYKLAMQSTYFYRLYLTRIHSTFGCDVFFPEIDWKNLQKINVSNIPENVQEEEGIKYEYQIYKNLKYEIADES